jgi:hypothetical protein
MHSFREPGILQLDASRLAAARPSAAIEERRARILTVVLARY